MALLSSNKVKFMLEGKLYTLQLTDNTKMQLKVKIGGNIYYVATKEEILDNLTTTQVYDYDNEIKVYYYVDGNVIQLGVKENIQTAECDTILYNEDNDFEMSSKVAGHKKALFVGFDEITKKHTVIKYSDNHIHKFSSENVFPDNDCIKLEETRAESNYGSILFNKYTNDNFKYSGNVSFLEGKAELLGVETEPSYKKILYNNGTEFNTENVSFSNSGFATIKVIGSTKQYVKTMYNNLDDFSTKDVGVVFNRLQLKPIVTEHNYKFLDLANELETFNYNDVISSLGTVKFEWTEGVE